MLCTLGACARAPELARPVAIAPALGPPGTALVIRGEAFPVKRETDFHDHSATRVDTAYQAKLGGVALEDVRWADRRHLSARVPDFVPVGVHDLILIDPWGRESVLSAAFEVTPAILRLAFLGPSQVLEAGTCVEARLGARKGEGPPAPMLESLEVALGAQPWDALSFFADPGCSRGLEAPRIAAGSEALVFYLMGIRAGPVTVRAESPQAEGTAQDHVIEAGPAAQVIWSPIASPQYVGEAFEVHLRALDALGNRSPWAGRVTFLADAPVRVRCELGCQDPETTAPFDRGAWRGWVSVRGPNGASVAILAGTAFTRSPSAPFLLGVRRSPPKGTLRALDPVALVGASVRLVVEAQDLQTASGEVETRLDPDLNPATPFSTAAAFTTTYERPGTYRPWVTFRDGDGDVGHAFATVEVLASPADLCVVDLASLVDDGATDCQGGPGPDGGLSLSEALRLSEARAGRQVITFAGPMTITGAQLRVEDPLGLTLAAAGDVTLEAAGIVAAAGELLLRGLSLEALAEPITVAQGASLGLSGVEVRDGPGLRVAGSLWVEEGRFLDCGDGQACIVVDGREASARILGSRFTGAPRGAVTASRCGEESLEVRSSVFMRSATALAVGCEASFIVHNTFVDGDMAIRYLGAGGHVLANNVVSGHLPAPIDCGAARFALRASQLLDGDPGCLSGDEGTLLAEAFLLDPWNDDLRPAQDSPAVDAGRALGLDLNGMAPGAFLGAGPDLGGLETW